MSEPLNIHPIMVHFPVALLTIYSLLELIRFKKLMEKPYWFYIKAAFSIVGAGAGYLTIGSGLLIYSSFAKGGLTKLVDTHKNFAETTVALFTLIGASYAVAWINKDATANFKQNPFWQFLSKISEFVLTPGVIIILALLGLLLVTITGSLGGAIAFGPDLDPAVHFFYHLLIK